RYRHPCPFHGLAEARAGELLAEMPKQTGDDATRARSHRVSELPTLAELGFGEGPPVNGPFRGCGAARRALHWEGGRWTSLGGRGMGEWIDDLSRVLAGAQSRRQVMRVLAGGAAAAALGLIGGRAAA